MTATILYALGVPEDTIMKDFMLTNDFVAAANPDGLKRLGADTFYSYYGVYSAYLTIAFNEMKSKYGSIDNYLTQVCGLTDAKRADLKAHYLKTKTLFLYKHKIQFDKSAIWQNNHEAMFFVTEKHSLFFCCTICRKERTE